jgi:pyridoxal phosphate enzyme (YggS family)
MRTEISTGSDSGLSQRYEEVKGRIAEAAVRDERRAEDVLLVVVTKNAGFETIRELIDLGHTDFGENRAQTLVARAAQAQEYIDRIGSLPHVSGRTAPGPLNWHMIGRLQRNKVRKVLDAARLVHSIDSLRLGEEIQMHASKRGEIAEVLIEVNVSGELSKAGIAPAAVRHVVDQIDTMLNVRPRGLMCMTPLTDDAEVVRDIFSRCREIFEDVHRAGSGGPIFNVLSMGMSSDFEIAIECGANLVRVGTAIIGDAAIDDEFEGAE